MTVGYNSLPPNLPVPEDDGAARHLEGLDLRLAAEGTPMAFVYPRTRIPGQPLVAGWDEIPGARDCTPQSCAFRDSHAEPAAVGASVEGVTLLKRLTFVARAGRIENVFYPVFPPDRKAAEVTEWLSGGPA